MHRAERDVWLLAIATSAPHLRERVLLPLRLTANLGQLQVVAQLGPWRIRAQ
jgi:hypothetical protein